MVLLIGEPCKVGNKQRNVALNQFHATLIDETLNAINKPAPPFIVG